MSKYRLGKLKPRFDPRTLRLSRYLGPSLPTPPDSVDYGAGVSYPMLLNDQIGDCAIAGPAHLAQTWTKCESGIECPVTDAQAQADYTALSGYDPSQTDAQGDNPTDTGCVLLDVLKYWRAKGIAGRKILGFAGVEPLNLLEVRQAAWLFGGLLIGVQLPESAMDQTDAGEPWDLVPGSPIAGGHCVSIVGYNATGPQVVSWGQVIQTTWRFYQSQCDEAWACLSEDWAAPGKLAPSGFDLPQLKADQTRLAA